MAYIVGICGGSASGKTYLLHRLMQYFSPEQCTLISQDNYYKPKSEQAVDAEGLVNYDHPDAFNFDNFARDIEALLRGETIYVEEYTYNNPHIVPRIFTYKPTSIIILEGIMIYHDKKLSQMMDMKVFVDADDEIRLKRRMHRDAAERNYTSEETLRDYDKFVRPMYEQFVAPTKMQCDIIIPNNHHMEVAVNVLINHLKSVL